MVNLGGIMYESGRKQLEKELRLLLGDQMIDVELDKEHYDMAISLSIDRVRQRSDGALEEEDIFISVQPNVQEYKLPDEVQEVRRMYRRGVGSHTTGGINFDPVDGAFFNAYLMQPQKSGGLLSWDMYNQFLETTERVFASQYNFVWYNSSKTLRIIRKPKATEDVMVTVWTTKGEDSLLNDPYVKPWIRSYSLAQCKGMLGQARSKFTSGFAGPSGNVTMNGSELIQQAQVEIERLDMELDNIYLGNSGYGLIIG